MGEAYSNLDLALKETGHLESAVQVHKKAMELSRTDVGTLTNYGSALQAAAKTVLEALGGLDLLVNNAGISKPAYLHETPLEDFERILRVNYFGTVNVTLAF
ncbi:MAG: SDR family NAD(P)-dependent oxidoreductase, partial [Pseudomonadota bacterium]|nr:SDR family NAD(P)-dependent oxidoreductase [Pseudomonadota bacterium]